MDIGGPEILIVLAVLLLVFGGSRLPGLARNVGEAVKELKSSLGGDGKDAAKQEAAAKSEDAATAGDLPMPTASDQAPAPTDGPTPPGQTKAA
jgi:sec-independent protein translocase protein TatA